MTRFARILKIFMSAIFVGIFLSMLPGESVGQKKPLYLVLYWHQHQPSYLDAQKGHLIGPWVRTHATKDYFDMVSAVEPFPNVHLTVDLSSVLISQLKEFYIDRLRPYVNLSENSFDTEGFLAKWERKTEPWIDILIKETNELNEENLDYLLNVSGTKRWYGFTMNENIFRRFPEYAKLLPEGMNIGSLFGSKPISSFTEYEKRLVKFYFFLAWFDPMFLERRVELPIIDEQGNQQQIDLTDLVDYNDSGTPDDDSDDAYTLKREITEQDCKRIMIDTYKIMASVFEEHKKLLFDPKSGTGQVEVVTTAYSHPIIPLLIDSDVMGENRPSDPRPNRFSYPGDADLQIKLGIQLYEEVFGVKPYGIWPSEGSVSVDALRLLRDNEIEWVATGPHNLARSIGMDHPNNMGPSDLGQFYHVQFESGEVIGTFFRDLELSDDIAFNYGRYTADRNISSFFASLEKYQAIDTDKDVVVTVLLDGENAWEGFTKDNDGREFFDGLYAELDKKYDTREIITVTPIEYIHGNQARGIPAHPIAEQKIIKKLHPGSWFSPDFTTWIGEEEENKGWNYLLELRKRMDSAEIPLPDLAGWNERQDDFKKAWQGVFEAEGSDWFWWYGADQTAPGGADLDFDRNYRLHLNAAYYYFKKAGYDIEAPLLPAIVSQTSREPVEQFSGNLSIDGSLIENDWSANSGFFNDDDGGVQFSKNDYIKEVRYGKSQSNLYLGIVSNFSDLETQLKSGSISIEIIYGSSIGTTENYLFTSINQVGKIKLRYDNNTVTLNGRITSEITFGVESESVEIVIPWSTGVLTDQLAIVITDDADYPVDVAPDYKPLVFADNLSSQIKVVFECDATDQTVTDRIYIAGSLENIGNWIPNRIPLYDDGTHGDRIAGDNIWSGEFMFEEGAEIPYKYTNSGREGVWSPGEEFRIENRRYLVVDEDGDGVVIVKNIFGILK